MDLAMLNRLRVNAGKPELKAWKASKGKLEEAIKTLTQAGFVDVLPGAKLNVEPVTDDPKVAAVLPKKEEPPVTKVRAKLGRGLETEPMARQSREAVRAHNREDAAERKAEKKEERKATRAAEKPETKKKDTKKVTKVNGNRKAVGDNEITVAAIARELNIDPKVARAKLRRHEGKISKLHTKGQDRWTFPTSAKKDIVAILK